MTTTEEAATDAQPNTSTENNCTNDIPHNGGNDNRDNQSQPTTSNSADANPNVKKIYAVSVRWEREQERLRQELDAATDPVTNKRPCLTFTIEDFHKYFCCCARRVGSFFFLLERKDGSPIIAAGPCWPFCTLVTVPLILVLSTLVMVFIVFNKNSGMPWWFALIYCPILAFVLIALFCVSCRDPGLMERVADEETAEQGWFWNEQVGSYRPAGAMYCREGKALIMDFDHVCPWTGTAIGRNNMLQFRLFVFSVNVLCYLSVGLVIWFVFFVNFINK
mmetsp:Transcript_27381/g.46337  ORF Transcript_27381/g.46337 Transcript_27381/m.46337 type:complete len:277 (-) Transcript_27381:547-1377(-)